MTIRGSSGCYADGQWTGAGPGRSGQGRATTEEEAQHAVPGLEGGSDREMADSKDQTGVGGEQREAQVNS